MSSPDVQGIRMHNGGRLVSSPEGNGGSWVGAQVGQWHSLSADAQEKRREAVSVAISVWMASVEPNTCDLEDAVLSLLGLTTDHDPGAK